MNPIIESHPPLRRLRNLGVALALLALGCDEQSKPELEPQGEGTESSEVPDEPSGTSANTPEDPEEGTGTGGPEDTDTTVPEDPEDCNFICEPDGPSSIDIQCSVWEQDCNEGEKCMPWANDGGNAWNATKCTPLDTAPGQPGDTCTVEGSGVSGVDTCDTSSMCWDVDAETNEGTCVAFCTGSDANPVCDDPSTSCSIANEGTLILCLPSCDPLLQDCADGQACYGIDNGFVCAPDASGPEQGAFGDPCEFINACDPGLACLNAAGVPGCTGSGGCCSSFCDTSDAGASAECEGAAGGQECVSYFEEGNAPPGSETVGICFIPM